MISDLQTAIKFKLNGLYGEYTVYTDYIPQHFKTPSFLISIADQNYTKLLKDTYQGIITFDVQYFSGAKPTDIKATRLDCLTVQENLFRAFDTLGLCHPYNMGTKIMDEVLHFTFTVKYSEKMTTASELIEAITISETIKE